jgi:hypothetical protein
METNCIALEMPSKNKIKIVACIIMYDLKQLCVFNILEIWHIIKKTYKFFYDKIWGCKWGPMDSIHMFDFLKMIYMKFELSSFKWII